LRNLGGSHAKGDVRLALVDLSSIKSIKAFATKLTGA